MFPFYRGCTDIHCTAKYSNAQPSTSLGEDHAIKDLPRRKKKRLQKYFLRRHLVMNLQPMLREYVLLHCYLYFPSHGQVDCSPTVSGIHSRAVRHGRRRPVRCACVRARDSRFVVFRRLSWGKVRQTDGGRFFPCS